MDKSEQHVYDLVVIGAGLAGMAAALFAANRGLSVVMAGKTSEIVFASGLFDLLGVFPVETGQTWENPWAGIEHLVQKNQKHPYTRMSPALIKESLEEIIIELAGAGLAYRTHENQNSKLITSMGTKKSSWGIPASMYNGVKAYQEKLPCLLIDFQGLKGFSARQIAETLKLKWPNMTTRSLIFPETSATGDMFAEHLARLMESPHIRQKLATALKSHINGAAFIGMPPILGVYNTCEVLSHFEELVGVPVFEIPSLPPSVPGLRLKETLEKILSQKGVKQLQQKWVNRVRKNSEGDFECQIGNEEAPFRSKGIILASGRFMGKGLHANRQGIYESVFDLPVVQPANRGGWHNKDFLHASGHPVNYAGIETDPCSRPLDSAGVVAIPHLYAAGSIIAHQDWKRMKCGSGLSVSTAYSAVNAFVKDRDLATQKAS